MIDVYVNLLLATFPPFFQMLQRQLSPKPNLHVPSGSPPRLSKLNISIMEPSIQQYFQNGLPTCTTQNSYQAATKHFYNLLNIICPPYFPFLITYSVALLCIYLAYEGIAYKQERPTYLHISYQEVENETPNPRKPEPCQG